MSHIATDETFLTDAPEIESVCWICRRKVVHRIGWLGEQCTACCTVYDPFETTSGDIVRLRRELLKRTRRQMAELTGYSIATIRTYEHGSSTEQYLKVTEELVKKHLKI